MANLCCQVNPEHTCRNCNEKICTDHLGATMYNQYHWCTKCAEMGDDFITIIQDQSNDLEALREGADELCDHVDTIYDHPARCRECKASEYCESLQGLISDAVDASNSYENARRKTKRNR